MFVVSERNKIIETGYLVAKLQRNCDESSEKNRKLNYHVGRLKSPEVIVYKVQSLKLPLIPQKMNQDDCRIHKTEKGCNEGNENGCP